MSKKIEMGEVKDTRIIPVKQGILRLKLGIIIAKYSQGDNIEDLKSSFVQIFKEWITIFFSLNAYNENLKMISLGILFNIEQDLILLVKKKLIENNNACVVENLSKKVDYIICNNKTAHKSVIETAENFCIPVISEKGFMCRFAQINPYEEDEDLSSDIFECTYEGDFYDMFYKYGIGQVTRMAKWGVLWKKLREKFLLAQFVARD